MEIHQRNGSRHSSGGHYSGESLCHQQDGLDVTLTFERPNGEIKRRADVVDGLRTQVTSSCACLPKSYCLPSRPNCVNAAALGPKHMYIGRLLPRTAADRQDGILHDIHCPRDDSLFETVCMTWLWRYSKMTRDSGRQKVRLSVGTGLDAKI